ncbi:MAG: DUF448 domain-containing protein, partial [Stellaceae bacterium]
MVCRRGGRCGRRTGVGATALGQKSAAAGRADRQEPTRRCLATGQVRPRAALLRFVVGPDGAIVADVAGRLPGRGLWLTPRRDIVEQAVAKRLFARAARRPVAVPPGLAD